MVLLKVVSMCFSGTIFFSNRGKRNWKKGESIDRFKTINPFRLIYAIDTQVSRRNPIVDRCFAMIFENAFVKRVPIIIEYIRTAYR